MKIDSYTVTRIGREGAPAARVSRIATDDGVYWLVDDGGRSRLIALPMPMCSAGTTTYLEDDARAPCEALALAAETEAAVRWVRYGRMTAAPERLGDVLDDDARWRP
jgi:hypothetical protein